MDQSPNCTSDDDVKGIAKKINEKNQSGELSTLKENPESSDALE